MRKFYIFIGGFIVGILTTIFTIYIFTVDNKPNDGLPGLTIFSENGECITTTKKKKSSEIEIFQVLEPNAALGSIKYYSEEKMYSGKVYRNYDIGDEIVILLINYDNKTYYDDQMIDVSNKCARQIGVYQYMTKSEFQKTVPVVVIE